MTRTRTRRIGAASVLALLASTLAGCSADKFTEPFRDAPRDSYTNGDAASVIEMPDGFSNAASKCDHGNRIYIAYHGDAGYASLAVVAQDPSCKGK